MRRMTIDPIRAAVAPIAARPWRALPPALASALLDELPALGDETIAAIRAEIPEYSRPLTGRFGRSVRRGVEDALARFVALVADSPEAERAWPPIYRELGAGEHRDGRSLDSLQAAYRLGARVAWRRLGAAATAAGTDAETLRLLAESIFAYIDELAAESVIGYAQAQSAAAGEREQRRRELAALLLAEPSAEPSTLSAAAREAGWTVPRRLAVVALDGHYDATLLGALGDEALPAGEAVIVVDPDGPGRRAALAGALTGRRVAVGPAFPPGGAARSARLARMALELVRAGRLASPAFADEHLAALVLVAGAEPLAELRAALLGPLHELPQAGRERLEKTLAAWLRNAGSAPSAAAELHVHAQTVRYRLARLRELLGDLVDDPARRLDLELALRAPAP